MRRCFFSAMLIAVAAELFLKLHAVSPLMVTAVEIAVFFWWWYGLSKAVIARSQATTARTVVIMMIPVFGLLAIAIGVFLIYPEAAACAPILFR